jgi:hypothetical protein
MDQLHNTKSSDLVPKQPVSQKVEMTATFAEHKQQQRYFISSKWGNEDVRIQVVQIPANRETVAIQT